MKHILEKRVNLNDVNHTHTLHLKRILDYLQEAAVSHSESVGFSSRSLQESGHAWVLGRVGVTIHRLPAYGEKLTITTWHRGANGFKGYREFLITCGEETVMTATSLWLYLDLHKRKLAKVPKEASTCYTIEEELATEMDLEQWSPEKTFTADHSLAIHTRPSDYDILGHVNNTLYLDYLETLIDRAPMEAGPLGRIMIQFNREISRDITHIEAGLKQKEKGWIFKIDSSDGTHASGEFHMVG